MTERNTVLKSVNLPGDARCVDIFRRPDGTFGFEEFRRDAEDARGWFPIGFFGDTVFESEETAVAAAKRNVPWFGELTHGTS